MRKQPTVPMRKLVLYLILRSAALLHSSLVGSLMRALLIFVLSIGAYFSELIMVMLPAYLFSRHALSANNSLHR